MKKYLYFLTSVACLLALFTGCATVQGDWEKARKNDSVYGYQKFLKDHPGSEYDDQARRRKEEIEWANTSKKGDVEAYRKFMKKYPEGRFFKESEEKLADLEWGNAKRQDTVSSYSYFLANFPSSAHAGGARQRIRSLKFEAARQAESVAAIEDFLELYPQGDDSDMLRQKLPALREWEPRKRLAQLVIQLCPKVTANLLKGLMRTPSPTYSEDLEEIRSLLDRGVDPNAVRIAGWIAAGEDRKVTVTEGGTVYMSTQINVGDPGHPVPADMAGMTLLDYCRANGLTEAYDLLKSRGAK